jgi:hypothetical protein
MKAVKTLRFRCRRKQVCKSRPCGARAADIEHLSPLLIDLLDIMLDLDTATPELRKLGVMHWKCQYRCVELQSTQCPQA